MGSRVRPLRLFEVLARNRQSALERGRPRRSAREQPPRMCTISPRQQLSSPTRLAIRRRNVIRRVLRTDRIKRTIDSSFRNSLNINHIRSHNLHIFHSRFAHGSTKMEEHHQLRGDDDESQRNNQTHSRCTPRDSALPPLDWHVYFPNVEYDVTSDRRCELASKLIDAFCLATNGAELFDQTKALHAKSIVIPFDYKALKRVLGDRVPDLFHALDLAPDEAFQALACAAHECLFYSLPKEERGRLIASGFKEKAFEGVVLANGENDEMISRRNNRNVIGKECKVTCHVYNFSSKFKVRDFRELKSSWLGRVVQLKGVVQKADATKPLCKSIFFKCEQCKESILVTLDKSGNFKAPANCETPKCRGKKGFTPDFERATTEDWRRVTLREEPNLGSGEGISSSSDEEEDDDEEEEFDEEEEEEEDFEPLDDDEEGGRKKKKRSKQNRRKSADELDARTLDRAPKHIECELSETLVDRIETAGERVQVCGIVRREECEEQRGTSVLGGKKTGSAIQRLYVDAVSVMPSASATGSAGAGYQTTNNKQTSTTNRKTETYQEIVKFSERCADDRLRVLVKSLCPSIYGHEIVKCGLLLCLFGGVRKADKSSKRSKNSSGKNNNKENNNANSVGAETSFDNDKENEENEGRQNESQRVHQKRRRSSLNAREQHQHKNHGAAGNETFSRGTSHCLVVGDPGMGKSQMLRAASRVAPLAIHVSGKSASTAGLTATVSRDPTSGAPTFEAGAVALAHGGVCCVDEFDKMKSEHASLLEAMEQQRVSVNKGGARASLPARTTILAAANPHKGRYDRSKSVRENLKMSAPLLSRFDLVFVLTDDPDEERDKRIGDNVTRLCGGRKVDERTGKTTNLTFAEKFQLERNKRREAEAAAALTQQQRSSVSASETILTSAKKQASQRVFSLNKQEASPDAVALMNLPPPSSSLRDGVGLKEYLERKSEEDVDDDDKDALYADYKRTSYDDMHSKDGIVSTSFMRKYVRYAKKYVHPTLSSDAKEVIKAFYLELRKNAPINDSAPVTARQLESLVRLSEARARVDLREIVTDRDAMDAVELYSLSMADVMRDDSGRLGAFGKRTGVSGKRKNFRVFIDAVNAATRNKGNAYFSVGELHALVEQTRLDGIKDIDAFIETLNLAGELLKLMKMKRRPNASGRRQQRANASSSSKEEEEKTEKTKVVVLTREAGKNEQMRKILASIDEDKDNEFVVETLEMPLVESKRNEEEAKKLVDLLKSKTFRWIIVTSPEAANVFAKAWADAGKPEGLNIGTEMKWARLFTPSKALGEVLAEELPLDIIDGDNESSNSESTDSNREVLYPCSKKAAKTIENGLSSRGFIVTRLNTYSTEQVTNIPKEVLERAVDASVVTFGSPSAVKAWKNLTLELLEERAGKHPTYACIGQTSANACEDCELPDVWHPEDPGMEGWAEVVKLCLEQDESEKWRGVF
ncbi:unnamed protein product [Bathycoccus prasinos]